MSFTPFIHHRYRLFRLGDLGFHESEIMTTNIEKLSKEGIVKHDRQPNWELYNIVSDNTELHNVAVKEPAILKDLVAHWNKWAVDKFVLPKRANN